MASFPQDPFDVVPADLTRVGAHRAPRRRGRGWIMFAWAALATGVLVVGGLYGLSRVDPNISFELPSFGGGEDPVAQPSPSTSTVPPVTDPTTVDWSAIHPKAFPYRIRQQPGGSIGRYSSPAIDCGTVQ